MPICAERYPQARHKGSNAAQDAGRCEQYVEQVRTRFLAAIVLRGFPRSRENVERTLRCIVSCSCPSSLACSQCRCRPRPSNPAPHIRFRTTACISILLTLNIQPRAARSAPTSGGRCSASNPAPHTHFRTMACILIPRMARATVAVSPANGRAHLTWEIARAQTDEETKWTTSTAVSSC